MKKSRILLLAISIIFVILSILAIIYGESKIYSSILLLVIYIPYLIVIIFSDSPFGKAISIGFCGVEVISSSLMLGSIISALIKTNEYNLIGLFIRLIIVAFNVIAIICFIRLLKGKKLGVIKLVLFVLLLIIVIYQLWYTFVLDYSLFEEITIIKNTVFNIIIFSYLIIQSGFSFNKRES